VVEVFEGICEEELIVEETPLDELFEKVVH